MRRYNYLLLGVWVLLVGSLSPFSSYAQNQLHAVENGAYRIQATAKSIRITEKSSGLQQQLKPAVQFVWLRDNPQLSYHPAANQLSPQAAWQVSGKGNAVKTTDFYDRMEVTHLAGESLEISGENVLTFRFRKLKEAAIQLRVYLPAGREAPVFEVSLAARKNGWYAAAFSGIPPKDTNRISFLYQPLIWSWRRFPDQSYLTPEHYATTAACFVNNGKYTEGITPDPSEIPYRYAHLNNSRFGLLLRNREGKAQPMLFAPIPGGQDSYMEAGETFSFRSRYVLKSGDWYEGLTYILKTVFQYKNERKNAAVSLNTTLDNMVNLAMNDTYVGWVDSLKGFSYEQDATGTVKVVSALHQLGLALIRGDKEIYRRRALPTIGYMMSREKYLFSPNTSQKTQSPSYTLNGPCADIGELSGLYQLTFSNTKAFEMELKRIFGKSRKLNLETETGGGTWQDYLHRYKVTNDPGDLKKARQGADEYLQSWLPYPAAFNNDPGLKDKNAAFLTDFTPRLYDLLELYELTRHKPYLDMAVTAARQMLLWTRSNPMAPDSLITVNEGGLVKGFIGKRYKLNSYDFLPGFNDTTYIQQEEVAAWQTSLVGLPPEQPGTYYYGPIMLTHHAAWFLRLAQLAGDSLLRDAAYNAILGRYAGFPGYYFTSLYTNVYQKRDYAMHPFMDIRYNALFHNHIFPHITLLIDFLVNDARLRSTGQVDFPGTYAPGYAYLSSMVYGNKTGKIFGNENIRLWIPPAALHSSSTALNHLLGVDNEDLYVVLMNTSETTVKEKIVLNKDLIAWTPGKTYKVVLYRTDGIVGETECRDGLLNLEVNASQLLACKIIGLKVEIPFSGNQTSGNVSGKEELSFFRDEQAEGFGTISGMLINLNPAYSDAYIYTNAVAGRFKGVVFSYRLNKGEWIRKEDFSYPFELEIHLPDPNAKLDVQLIGVNNAGDSTSSKIYSLSNNQ